MQRRALRTLFYAIALAITSFAATADEQPNDALRDLPDNTWVRVSKGDVTAPLGIMAFSGGWYDSVSRQFCIFGGGHFNYSGNEVWCLDSTTLTWTELYPPDVVAEPPYSGADQGGYENYDNEQYPGALFDPAGEPIQDARPMSRHTYDQLEYVPGLGALLWGGFPWGDSGSPWCRQCMDTWSFDFEQRSWNYLYDGDNPSPNVSPGVGASAYSSHDGLLYAVVFDETWTFDPCSNKWAKIRTRGSPPWSIEGTLEYDPIRDNLYFFGGNYEPNLTLWRFDIKKRSWSAVKTEGPGPSGPASNGPGVAYDTHNDALLVYYGGTIWAFDPKENSWHSFRPDTRPSDEDYVFGRFRYDPVNNGFWLHAAEDGQHTTWFYRYRN